MSKIREIDTYDSHQTKKYNFKLFERVPSKVVIFDYYGIDLSEICA